MTSTPAAEHGVVLQLGGFEGGQSDTAVVEEELDRDEPAEEIPDLRRDDRDRGEDRVTEYVPPDDRLAWESLEERSPRVVGLEGLHDAGAGDPRDISEEDEGESDRRQRQMLHLCERS